MQLVPRLGVRWHLPEMSGGSCTSGASRLAQEYGVTQQQTQESCWKGISEKGFSLYLEIDERLGFSPVGVKRSPTV